MSDRNIGGFSSLSYSIQNMICHGPTAEVHRDFRNADVESVQPSSSHRSCCPRVSFSSKLLNPIVFPANSRPQNFLFESFFRVFGAAIPNLPALLPEVWLHWDPKTVQERGADGSQMAESNGAGNAARTHDSKLVKLTPSTRKLHVGRCWSIDAFDLAFGFRSHRVGI